MGKVHLRIGASSLASACAALSHGLCMVFAAECRRRATIDGVPRPVDYTSQIKPILTRHCVTCHGAAKPRGGLRLDTAAAAMAGGKSGPAVLPGKGAESPLIEALRGEGATDRMPLNRPPLPRGRDQAHRSLDRPGGQGTARRKAGRAARQVALGVCAAGEAGRSQASLARAGLATRSTALSRRASKRPACRPRPKPIGAP